MWAGNCTITVTFTPAAVGARSSTLAITTLLNPVLTVPLSGTGVTPVAALLPASLAFGQQAINTTSVAQALVLSNTGTAALDITSIGTTGDFGQTNACGTSLAAGANCAIVVTFTPTVVGPLVGTLTLASNDVANPSISIALSGTGDTVPIGPNNFAVTNSALSVNPPTVTLTWSDRSLNEAGFQIQRATNNAFTAGLVNITVGPDVVTYTDTTVVRKTAYYYRVRSFIPGELGLDQHARDHDRWTAPGGPDRSGLRQLDDQLHHHELGEQRRQHAGVPHLPQRHRDGHPHAGGNDHEPRHGDFHEHGVDEKQELLVRSPGLQRRRERPPHDQGPDGDPALRR